MKISGKFIVVLLFLLEFPLDVAFSDYKENLKKIQNKIESQQSELSKIEHEIKKYKDNLNALSSKEKKNTKKS
jgi:prefoldin subunit 5